MTGRPASLQSRAAARRSASHLVLGALIVGAATMPTARSAAADGRFAPERPGSAPSSSVQPVAWWDEVVPLRPLGESGSLAEEPSDGVLRGGWGEDSEGTLFRWRPDGEASVIPNFDEPLASDRPDFTEASSTVGRGVLQIESGYTYFFDDEADVTSRTHTFGEFLFRYGVLANWLELRVGLFPVDEAVAAGSESTSATGISDLYLGAKIGLVPQDGWLPEIAVMPQMTVPTASDDLTSGHVLPGLNVLYGWDVTDRLSVAGSTQFNRAVDDETGTLYTSWAQSGTVGYGFTEKLGGYAELFSFFPDGAETASVEHYFDFGFTYRITNDLQWDVRYGRGLNSAATDYFVGTGLVVRLH